jgi:exopolysaccharide production protein ExoQ
MMSLIASVVFACGIWALFVLDRDRSIKTSLALWLPVAWMLIGASRNVSEWLAVSGPTVSSDSGTAGSSYLDGNPVDRNVMTLMLLLAVIVLVGRWKKVSVILRSNAPLLMFFAYCAVSSIWSEHPDVSIKRWIKALGDLMMVMLVLTENNQVGAVKRFFARTGFILLPLSVLFIRYYSDIGRAYSPWDGGLSYTGVTTSKNLLGMICLIFGLAATWRLLDAMQAPKAKWNKRSMAAQVIIIVLGLWLIWTANSMTPFSCFVLAATCMVWASRRAVVRRPVLVHLAVVGVLSISFSALFLNIGSGLVQNLGRDSSLTGRTEIWNMVTSMTPNRLLGAGYESFWVGERLKRIWAVYWSHPNQAHNGYIEIYLNLGWIGVCLLVISILTGYRTIIIAVQKRAGTSLLRLGYFVAAVAYNFTESAFKMTHPVWITFLLATMAVPEFRPLRRPATKPELIEKPQVSEIPVPVASTYEEGF